MDNNQQPNNNGPNGKLPFDFFDEGPTLKDYIPVLWRGKWIILLIVLAVFNVAIFFTMVQEPEYEAAVSVYINTKGQKTSILGGLAVDDVKNIGNELELLKSRMIAETVAERLTEERYLEGDRPEPIPILVRYEDNGNNLRWLSVREVTSRLRNAVSFSSRRDSDFIVITARSSSNEEAALLANTYAQVYYDRNFHLSRQQSRSVREFLENQLASKRYNLEEAEQEMRDYMEQHGVVRIDDETRRVIDQISQLEAQREATKVEIQSLSNTLSSLRQQLTEQEPNVARSISSADNPYIRMIQEQMAELEVERDLTLTQNPDAQEDERYRRMIVEIDEQLEVLRTNLRRRTEEFMQSLPPGGTYADPAGFIKQLRQRILEHDIQLQGLEFKRTAIDESLQRFERQFDQLPQVNMEYARLARARTSNEKLYLMLEERYNEALIAEQSEFGSVDIIDPALVPNSPVSPNLRMNLLLGILLGMGLGFVFVIGRERLYNPVRIPEDLRKNGYDTLTTVSSMYREIKDVLKNGSFMRNGVELDPALIMLSNPLSPAAEAFRLLRTNLKFARVDKKLKTIVITSPNPGEGKSTIAANMGIAYAQAGERVLLLDCDLRKPSLSEELSLWSKPGLTEVLAGEMSFAEAVQKTVVDNLDLLACGTLPANPAELLGSNTMKSLLETLGSRYQIIILDSPPVLAASDPLVLSTVADGVVLVAAANRTKTKELDLTRDSLQRVGSRITGVVLNFFDYRHAYGSAYAYKYYKYGSYGYSRNGGGNSLKEIKVK